MIVLVGNADLQTDHAHFVNSSDFVVRFNTPRTYGQESGTRFDAWVIANSGGGRNFATNRTFMSTAYKDQPSQLWFPRDIHVHRELRKVCPDSAMLKPDAEVDFSREIINSNNLRQVQHVRFSSEFYRECIELVDKTSYLNNHVKIPSSGFMALCYVLKVYRNEPVTLVGFTFEGWHGHPWHQERMVIQKWENERKLAIR